MTPAITKELTASIPEKAKKKWKKIGMKTSQ